MSSLTMSLDQTHWHDIKERAGQAYERAEALLLAVLAVLAVV